MYMVSIYVESNSRQVPGCGDRIRAAPAQGEQPDPITLRCGYCWLKGSMMLFEYSETSQLVLLLPL